MPTRGRALTLDRGNPKGGQDGYVTRAQPATSCKNARAKSDILAPATDVLPKDGSAQHLHLSVGPAHMLLHDNGCCPRGSSGPCQDTAASPGFNAGPAHHMLRSAARREADEMRQCHRREAQPIHRRVIERRHTAQCSDLSARTRPALTCAGHSSRPASGWVARAAARALPPV